MDGTKLRARREAAGMTERQFARAVGVRPKTLARWERGESRVSRHRRAEQILTERETKLGTRRAPILYVAHGNNLLDSGDDLGSDGEADRTSNQDDSDDDASETGGAPPGTRRVYVPVWLPLTVAGIVGLIWAARRGVRL